MWRGLLCCLFGTVCLVAFGMAVGVVTAMSILHTRDGLYGSYAHLMNMAFFVCSGVGVLCGLGCWLTSPPDRGCDGG